MKLAWSGIFRAYRLLVSPVIQVAFDVHCRYEESCSRYAERAIREQGVARGLVLAVKRILSCNSWSKNG